MPEVCDKKMRLTREMESENILRITDDINRV